MSKEPWQQAIWYAWLALSGAVTFFIVFNTALELRFEDAMIALRYARNLVEGHGFVFNPGERILGITTPLHTLLSALYVLIGGDFAATYQNCAGVFFLAAEALLVLRLANRLVPLLPSVLASVLVFTNFAGHYLYLGMEVHLFTFLVLLAFSLFLDKRDAWCGVVLGLAFFTRYDAALLAGLIGVYLLFRRRRFPWRLTTAFLLTVSPWLLFAQLYFGSVLPTTLAAKDGASPVLDYLLRAFFENKAAFKRWFALYTSWELLRAGLSYLFLIPIVGGIGMAIRTSPRWAVLGAYPFLHVLVYAVIGSDPGFVWHYYLLVPIFYLLFVVGAYSLSVPPAERFIGRVTTRSSLPALVTSLVIVAVTLPLAVDLVRSVRRPYRMSPHTEQLQTIGRWLGEHYDEETTLLQPAIGILGYESRLHMIDHAGLVTPGLYFFDDDRCTPVAEVLLDFEPDLVLLSAASSADVTTHGYRLVRRFPGATTYTLYRRAIPDSQGIDSSRR